jgi:hypothetical protein
MLGGKDRGRIRPERAVVSIAILLCWGAGWTRPRAQPGLDALPIVRRYSSGGTP